MNIFLFFISNPSTQRHIHKTRFHIYSHTISIHHQNKMQQVGRPYSFSRHTSSYICSLSSHKYLACLNCSSKLCSRSSSAYMRFSNAFRDLLSCNEMVMHSVRHTCKHLKYTMFYHFSIIKTKLTGILFYTFLVFLCTEQKNFETFSLRSCIEK